MLLRERKLVLADIEEIKFPDKETGEEVTKFKYTFFDEENKTIIGYSDQAMWEHLVSNKGEFQEQDAIMTKWQGREFQGTISWRLSDDQN